MESSKNEIKEKEEGYLILGGDFNARTEREGEPIGRRGRKEEEARRSRDKTINRVGRIMINEIKERGCTILNESFEKGEWMYIGETRASTIDYIVVNEKAREEVKVTEGCRIKLNHVSLEVGLESTGRYKEYKKRKREAVKNRKK